MSVPALLMVKGRTTFENGPTLFTTSLVFGSAIDITGEARPARKTFEPSGLQIVLCAPFVSGVGSDLIRLPVLASTTYQFGPSKDGTYRVFPSGETAMRSQQCPS